MTKNSSVIENKWLQITKIVVSRDTVTAQIPISLSALEWTQVVMIADKNEIAIEEVIAYLIRNENALIDIANNQYLLTPQEKRRIA